MKNTRRVIRSGLLAALLVSATALLAGWGEDGHRIVSKIAQDRLTPQAAAAVNDLLAGQSLADVCVWADQVRPQLQYSWSAPMHYINLPEGAAAVDLARDCADKDGRPGCVVAAIGYYTQVLRSESATRDEKIEALKFVVHFVGDIHQPLHVSYAKDRGGNDLRLTFYGVDANLHRVWDTDLIKKAMNNHTHDGRAESYEEYASRIGTLITPEREAIWGGSDPATWAGESWRITNAIARHIPDNHELGDEYFLASIGAVDERLCMGGVRLAAVLNDVFASTAPAVIPAGGGAPEPATPASTPPTTDPKPAPKPD